MLKIFTNTIFFGYVLLTSPYIYASDYEYYSCPKGWNGDKNSCAGCKKEEFTVSFKVNVDKQIVFIQSVAKKTPIKLFSLEKCQVVDKLNWSCVVQNDMGSAQWFRHTYTMTDGHFKREDIVNGNLDCLKKINWFNKLF